MDHPQTADPGHAGMAGRCPRCGQGQLFAGYLKVAKACAVCGLDFAFADSGDGPAFFVMSITGVAAVAMVMLLLALGLAAGIALILGCIFALAVTLLALRPAKGLLVGLQYKNDASEGRLQ
jgi:uncharacterized protein (DUF983 family)